jgi:REP element-mobilizing transposase RayT
MWINRNPERVPAADSPTIAQHIVFYRRDALSDDMARRLEQMPPAARLGAAEAWLDAGHGEGGLTDEAVANALAFAIRARQGRYDLLAWCIMPTHVHVLIVPRPSTDPTDLVGDWTGVPVSSAQSPSRSIEWSSTFFVVSGSGDAWIAAVRRHIEGNPVAAGLASDPKSWPWSTASWPLGPSRPPRPARTAETTSPPPPSPPRALAERATHVVFWLDDALSWRVRRDLARRPPAQQPYVLDKALDRGRGRQSLIGRGAAATVQRELLAADGERYGLIAWCVMPTHVHVLFTEVEEWPVAEIVGLWKSDTLTAANARRIFRFGASPWAEVYSRTAITCESDIEDVKSYIEHNPVLTGLARTPDAWRWSSATHPRAKVGRP